MRRTLENAGLAWLLAGVFLAATGFAVEPATPGGSPRAKPVNTDGLVAYYTFDEPQGTRLTDHSGNGNHGQIHGAVSVAAPRGRALRFDGQDDYVDLGRSPTLEIDGDLTIEVWLKTDCRDKPKTHRLIVGSTAGLTIMRNYNFRIDHHNELRLEWGDGQQYGVVAHDPSFLDGSWKYLAVVIESPGHGYLFVDGRLVGHQVVDVPIAKTGGGPVHIGGWGHGFFQGEIDELRIYNRALSSGEIRAHGGRPPGEDQPRLDLQAGYSFQRNAFVGDLFWMCGENKAVAANLRVTAPGGQKAVAAGRFPLGGPTRPGSGRWFLQDITLPCEPIHPGDYRVEADLLDDAEHVLAKSVARVPCTARPAWLDAKVGITEKVLPPYQPCEVKRRGEETHVFTWGRRYRFGTSPLLGGIESAGSELLAQAVRIDCAVGGKPEPYSPGAPELRRAGPAKVRLRQQLAGPKSRLVFNTQVEYDGFLKVDWHLEAKQALDLDRLVLEIPLCADHARLFYSWPHIQSGALKEDWASRFQPILWIGDEERGLCWVAESEENWFPANPHKAIEVVRSEDQVVLRFNLVTRKVHLDRGEKLGYTFGLEATPVRPMRATMWDTRLVRQPPYAQEYQWLTRTIGGEPSLEFYAGAGVRSLLVLRWWDAFSYTLPLGQEQRFSKLVAACHRRNLKVVPYAIGFLLSEVAPEYKYFQADMLVRPRKPYPIDRLPGMKRQMTYFACRKGAWQDFVVASTARCMDQYDTDGVYLDSTVMLVPCRNRLHGCGYVKPDGTVGATYPIFATRELMKRLYTVVKSRKPDGIVDAHVYDCLNVPALAFATSYWNGEQLPKRAFKPDALPLDRFRTEFMGHNLGVPADLLYYRLGDYDACTALALLHDVPVRSENEKDLAVLASIWRVRESFGCDGAEFVGYWKSDPLVKVRPAGCYASLWRHPRHGVLAAVANFTRQPAEIELALARKKLGLADGATAEDARAGKPLKLQGDRVSVKLDSQGWTLIWLRPPR